MKKGLNCIIGQNVTFGENVVLGHNVIIEDDVVIGNNSYIDSNTIIRSHVTLGDNAFVESNCILGEYWMDFCMDRKSHEHPLIIGQDALLRSGTILYAGSKIGDGFQSGHRVTVRERAEIGNHVSVGTLSDIQGNCRIGNYVRMHSYVHIGQLSVVDDFVWIFPYVVLTNDPTPPSDHFMGVHIHPFAVVATGTVVMPGVEIGQDALIGACSNVTKDAPSYAVVVGNPGKVVSDVRKLKHKVTGAAAYPWRNHFAHYMPWAESDFETWYASLDIPQKEAYHIENLEE